MRERKREERDTCKSAKPSYSVSARAGIGRKRKEIKWGLRHVDPLRLISQHRRPRHIVYYDCRQPGVHRGHRSSDEVRISSYDMETRNVKPWPLLTSSTRSWHPPRRARMLVSSKRHHEAFSALGRVAMLKFILKAIHWMEAPCRMCKGRQIVLF